MLCSQLFYSVHIHLLDKIHLNKLQLYNPELVKTMTKYGDWYFALKNCPEVLRQLTQSEAGYNHEFMMFPSN